MRRIAYVGGALAVLVAAAAILRPISKAEDYQLFGELLTRVETSEMVVALTLDDGPSPHYPADVLQILADRDATATFFLTGHEVERRPELAADIVAAGHDVANHSFTHNRLVLKFPGTIRWELNETDRLLRDAEFTGPLQFRPPYGQKLVVLPLVLQSQNRASIMWDVEAGRETLSPEVMAQDIIDAAQPGSIILMHVMYASRETSRAALPLVIDGLRDKGFELVGLNALLALRD